MMLRSFSRPSRTPWWSWRALAVQKKVMEKGKTTTAPNIIKAD